MCPFPRLKYYGDGDVILHHKRGIYSIVDKQKRKLHYTSNEECTGKTLSLYLKPINKYMRKGYIEFI